MGDKTNWNAHRIASRPVVVRPVGNDVQRPRRGEASRVEVALEVPSLPLTLRTVGTYCHRNRLTPDPYSSAMAGADNPTASPTRSHVITFDSPRQLTPRCTPRCGGWARIGVAAVRAAVSPSAAGSRPLSPPHAATAIDTDAKSAGNLTPGIRRDPLGKSAGIAKGPSSGCQAGGPERTRIDVVDPE